MKIIYLNAPRTKTFKNLLTIELKINFIDNINNLIEKRI